MTSITRSPSAENTAPVTQGGGREHKSQGKTTNTIASARLPQSMSGTAPPRHQQHSQPAFRPAPHQLHHNQLAFQPHISPYQHMPPPHMNGTPSPVNGVLPNGQYPPEMAAMMYAAAFQQQQQHFQAQMAAFTNNSPQNDPRQRTGSFNNSPSGSNQSSPGVSGFNPDGYFAPHQAIPSQQSPYYQQGVPFPNYVTPHQHQQMHYPQQAFYHPQHHPHPHPLHNPHGISHAPFAAITPMVPPQAPFAVNARSNARSASPSSTKSASASGRSASPAIEQSGRARTGSETSENRSHYHPHRGRMDSTSPISNTSSAFASIGGSSRHASPHHSPQLSAIRNGSPSLLLAPVSPASLGQPTHIPLPLSARSRTDSQASSQASSSYSPFVAVSTRSASPAASDRAPTPTSSIARVGNGRSTPTPPVSSELASSVAVQPSPSAVSMQTQRKASSPLAQGSSGAQSTRSITPTQSRLNEAAPQSPSDSVHAGSDETTSDNILGHKASMSNASSVATSVSAESRGHTKSHSASGGSLFRSKLRKALSLSELNKYDDTPRKGHESAKDKLEQGRASLTSNSSSSDTSNSTTGPHTPPNGASLMPRGGLASASVTSLNTQLNVDSKATMSHAGGVGASPGGMGTTSLPSNSGRRFGLLNSKLNSSSDNLSISSTVSSASMMLRKIGSLGKLGRKSSVRSLSNLFHRGPNDRGESITNHSNVSSDAVSEFGVPGAAISSSKDRPKRSGLSTSYTTSDTAVPSQKNAAGMTPAAEMVRKHQEREKAEEERKAALAAATSAVPIHSPRSKLLEKEKERLKNANKDGKKSLTKKFSFSAFAKNKSVADAPTPASTDIKNSLKTATEESSVIPVSAGSQVLEEGAEIDDAHLEHATPTDWRPSLDNIKLDSWRHNADGVAVPASASQTSLINGDDEGFDDRTPRQSMEIMGDVPGDVWDGEAPTASFFDDDTASFNQSQDDSHSSGRFFPEPEDVYDDGGHDGRSGQAIPERPHPSARPTKSILKTSRSFVHANGGHPNPAFLRQRANSYDAPHQTSAPNKPGTLVALAQVIPSGEQIDGTAGHAITAPRQDNRPTSPSSYSNHVDRDYTSNSSSSSHSTQPYAHHNYNTSEPVLAHFNAPRPQPRAMTALSGKRRIAFAQNLSVHTTWSGTIYDRRGELATCNRLTPQLAQLIKDELNTYKLEEMEVHQMSRDYTHFFV